MNVVLRDVVDLQFLGSMLERAAAMGSKGGAADGLLSLVRESERILFFLWEFKENSFVLVRESEGFSCSFLGPHRSATEINDRSVLVGHMYRMKTRWTSM